MSDQSQPAALVPIEQRQVDFYGDNITAALVQVGDEAPQVYVPLRPICDYLGLDWSAQMRRTRRDEILNEALISVAIMATEIGRGQGSRTVLCLQLEQLPGWLFGVTASRVKPELAERIARYRRECFRVLWQAFQDAALLSTSSTERATTTQLSTTSPNTPSNLTQIRDLGLAVAQLAQQQMIYEEEQATLRQQQLVLEQRQQAVEQGLISVEQTADAAGELAASAHARLNQAASVVIEIRNQLNILDVRTSPQGVISNEQASQVALTVKALATHLKQLNPQGPNQYQAVYTELYRRFGVSTYKGIRRNQFEAVLNFLEEWRSTGNTPPSATGD